MNSDADIPAEKIADFCKRHKITEFALFGSVLTQDFRADSDIDVLVTFRPDCGYSLFDLASIQDELSQMLGRQVDLVEKQALRNPFRRQTILSSMEVIYAA